MRIVLGGLRWRSFSFNWGEVTQLDREIAKLATAQHNAFSRRQALAIGMTPKAIRWRLETGRWVTLGAGLYAIAGPPATRNQCLVAALLAAGPLAAISHLAAAALWELIELEPSLIDVVVLHGSLRGAGPGRVIHQANHLDRVDVRTLHGIRVTSPCRTLVDIAGVLSREALEAALDAALYRGLVTVRVVHRYIKHRRLEQHSGIGTLMKLLSDRGAGGLEFELERRFLRLIRKAKLPEPKRQYRVGRARVDFAYPDFRIAIELDGLGFHYDSAVFRRDRRRQNALVLGGWLVLRFTWDDVANRPGSVVDVMRRALST
ncbi:MAG: type IV toxin-antitoxin system AbiEi family antitoxin domain-containing protein [Actinomycetota bacterium]